MTTTEQLSVPLPLPEFKKLLAEVVREEIRASQACPAEKAEDGLMTIKETCTLLKVTRPTIYSLMKQGKLRYVYLAKNRLRFRKADVQEYITVKNAAQPGR